MTVELDELRECLSKLEGAKESDPPEDLHNRIVVTWNLLWDILIREGKLTT